LLDQVSRGAKPNHIAVATMTTPIADRQSVREAICHLRLFIAQPIPNAAHYYAKIESAPP
jgi:hypothetical protein